MVRHSVAALLAIFVLTLSVLGADKEVKGKLVKVDAKKNALTITAEDGKEHIYDVADDTKFIGPKGGVSDKGIKDDRLTKGVELKLIVAGNNRTLREVHIPVIKN